MFICPKCDYAFYLRKQVEQEPDQNDFMKCDNCGYYQKIKNSTCIYQKSKEYNLDHEILPQFVVNDIYPRKTGIECINKKCPTHKDKNAQMVMYRTKTYKFSYICTTCHTIQEPQKK